MTCAACAAKVENKLNAIENVTATVNFATEKATITAPSPVSVRLALESSRSVDTVVLDKTGTVTTGVMAVTGVARAAGTSRAGLLRHAGAVEQASEHAVAAAIPLAAAGFLNPLIAGAAMAASSAFVVASSARLRRFGVPATARGLSRRPAAPMHEERSGGRIDAEEHAASCLE